VLAVHLIAYSWGWPREVLSVSPADATEVCETHSPYHALLFHSHFCTYVCTQPCTRVWFPTAVMGDDGLMVYHVQCIVTRVEESRSGCVERVDYCVLLLLAAGVLFSNQNSVSCVSCIFWLAATLWRVSECFPLGAPALVLFGGLLQLHST